jgi:hypothetical protein
MVEERRFADVGPPDDRDQWRWFLFAQSLLEKRRR